MKRRLLGAQRLLAAEGSAAGGALSWVPCVLGRGLRSRSEARILLKRLSSSKRSTRTAAFVSHVPSPPSLRELQVSPLRSKVSDTLSAPWHGLLPEPSRLTLPLHLPMRAVRQRLQKPGTRRPQALLDGNPGLQRPAFLSRPGRAMGGEQKQVAIGALEGALWGRGQTCARARGLESSGEPRGALPRSFWMRKVAGQGTRGEPRQGGKESNRSLFPWWREGSRVQFQIKQTGRRGMPDAGRWTLPARVR